MLTENGIHHNGFHTNGVATPAYPECLSDYEPRPQADASLLPGWRNQHPKYVHHLEWVDADNRKHGLTLRTDDRDEMVATLRIVKAALNSADAATESGPEDDAPEQQVDDKPTTKPCPVHPHDLLHRRPSKHGGYFYSHRLSDGSWCNGRLK